MFSQENQGTTHGLAQCKPAVRWHHLSTFCASMGLSLSLATAAVAATSSSTAKGAVLSYAQMNKRMGQANQTERMRQALVGQVVQLKLQKSGPTAFVVSPEDGISFSCAQRAPSFKGGSVQSQITNIEDTPEGNFMVTLQRCDAAGASQ